MGKISPLLDVNKLLDPRERKGRVGEQRKRRKKGEEEEEEEE